MNNRPVRVLIAEDDYFVLEEIKRTLRGQNYEIVGEAYNGESAVKMVNDLHPDVVLMDIKMPKMDGLEASQRIQEQCATPIVVLTAHEPLDLVENASIAGVSAYLTKPPSAVEIYRAIIIAMARHEDWMKERRLNKVYAKASHEIKTLRGIVPICSYCKQIRDDQGNWAQVEEFVENHTYAKFSHATCPDCAKKHYPDIFMEKETE